jgi:hypothetical protein
MSESTPRFESRRATLLTNRALLVLNAYGVMLMIPALVAILTVSIIRLSWWSVVIPAVAVVISLLLLPLGFGNLSLSRWLRPVREKLGQPSFVVQLRFVPQRRSMARALLEDADDIGVVCAKDGAFSYQGDAFSFLIPLANVVSVESRNIGWRGFFIYGNRCLVTCRGIPELQEIELAERQSLILPQSWTCSRRLVKSLRAAVEAGA